MPKKVEEWPINSRGALRSESSHDILEAAAKVSPIQIIPPDQQLIYNLLRQERQGLADRRNRTHSFAFNHNPQDPLLAFEFTSIGRLTGDAWQTYKLTTDLLLSARAQANYHHGYYGFNRLLTIRGILATSGLASDFNQDRHYNNHVHIPLNLMEVQVKFGPESRDAEAAQMKDEVKRAREECGRVLPATQERAAQPKRDLTNSRVNVELITPRYPNRKGVYLELGTFNRFNHELTTYRLVTAQIIAAMYQEAGLPIPERTLTWQPLDNQPEGLDDTPIQAVI